MSVAGWIGHSRAHAGHWSRTDYACPGCGVIYDCEEAAEVVTCGGCGAVQCGSCVTKCESCDTARCSGCLKSVDFGSGIERLCVGCVTECEKVLDKCSSCGEPRSDLQDVDDNDESVGYRSVEKVCGPCRNPGKKHACVVLSFATPRAILSDDCPF